MNTLLKVKFDIQDLRFLFDIRNILQNWGLNPEQAEHVNLAFGIFNILLLAWLAYIITRKVIIVLISRAIKRTRNIWDDILLEKRVFGRISYLAPALVLWRSVGHVLYQYPYAMNFIQKALAIYMIIMTLAAISAFLKSVNDIYQSLPAFKGRSIRGYIQVVQIIIYSLAILSIITILTGIQAKTIITGLGLTSAVLMLVFKDTILGFVAGIQLSGNDMLRIGDQISMPKYGADGNVIEITLNTVKVRNYDKTITTIPTYAMVSDSFINWRGLEDESSRRFKKYINIDMKSVAFCTPEMLERLSSIKPIKEFIERQDKKIKKTDAGAAIALHEGELTNLTLFRKYIVGILRNHSGLNHKLSMLVHQLQPTENGLPLEIIAFVKGTDGLVYEELQSDLFDHLLAILPEFELNVFQNPTSNPTPQAVGKRGKA